MAQPDDAKPTAAAEAPTITVDVALGHAARILLGAEIETDRHLMERYEKLADSWISIANTLLARERES